MAPTTLAERTTLVRGTRRPIGVPAVPLCFGCWTAVPAPSPGWSSCLTCPTCDRHECGVAQEAGTPCVDAPEALAPARRSRWARA